jgi:hypothetical protein
MYPRPAVILPLVLVFTSCTAGSEPPSDVCDEAARYREACTGEYITPPICDEPAVASAEHLLELDCEQLEQLAMVDGKADGAFCD